MSEEKTTYHGSCHCGDFAFEVEVPEIKAVMECNCSLCVRKAYSGIFTGPIGEVLKVVTGSIEALPSYTFGDRTLEHKVSAYNILQWPKPEERLKNFVPSVEHRSSSFNQKRLQRTVSVSACAVSEALTSRPYIEKCKILSAYNFSRETWQVNQFSVNGASLGGPRKPIEFDGALPNTKIEGAALYTGSCHCGSQKIAFSPKARDDAEGTIIKICKCSHCLKSGSVFFHPTESEDQIAMQTDGNHLGIYSFMWGDQTVSKVFCKVCGVLIMSGTNSLEKKPGQIDAVQTEHSLGLLSKAKAVNLRALDGFDLDIILKEEQSLST